MKTATALKQNGSTKTTGGMLYLSISAMVSALLSMLALVIAGLILIFNSLERLAVPCLLILAVIFMLLYMMTSWRLKTVPKTLLVLAGLALLSSAVIYLLPEYLQGFKINGIIHRSLISGLLLLVVALFGAGYSLFCFFKATPRALDISRYPLLGFFAFLAVAGLVTIIVHVIQDGTSHLSWSLFTQSFIDQSQSIEEWHEGWPDFSWVSIKQIGLLNNILGTLLLMGLTSLFALPIGMSVGIYIHEYAGSKLGSVINFCTTALRSISGIIIAVTAITLINSTQIGTFWFSLFHGFGTDINDFRHYGRSSFLFSSAFISLLVIPIIAKATQEGLTSLPKDIKEGSLAIGASREHTLFHIQLPWCLPNIVTGLMLGCAEAAGALTIIFLLAGNGQYGVSPLNETTSLAFLIFDMRFGNILGDANVFNLMRDYQYTAALVLLLLTLGLTVTTLIMKKNLARRYKGA